MLEWSSLDAAKYDAVKPCLSAILTSCVVNFGCSPSYGLRFPNSAPSDDRDVYLYGPHRTVAQRVRNLPEAKPAKGSVTTVPSETGTGSPPVERNTKDVVVSESVASEPTVRSPAVDGTYRGTDWVTIDLPGFPESEQVDDKARVVLGTLADEHGLTFTVLDTSSGSELCSVDGTLVNQLIVFEAGQSCFEGILGLPMQAVLYEGEGHLVEGKLDVTLGIELTVSGADGELTGDLAYRFEGKFAGVEDAD